MKVSEILRAGKQALLDRGWCQGDEAAIFGRHGKCCAATALTKAPIEWRLEHVEFPGNAAMRYLKAAAGIQPNDPIAAWNDAPERTLADVLFAYDLAITAAEQQEQQP